MAGRSPEVNIVVVWGPYRLKPRKVVLTLLDF